VTTIFSAFLVERTFKLPAKQQTHKTYLWEKTKKPKLKPGKIPNSWRWLRHWLWALVSKNTTYHIEPFSFSKDFMP